MFVGVMVRRVCWVDFGGCGAVLGKCERLEEGSIVAGEIKGRKAPKITLFYTFPILSSLILRKGGGLIYSVSLPYTVPASPRQRIQGRTLFLPFLSALDPSFTL